MLIVILGPDGSGKTTLAKLLSKNNDLPYLYFGNNLESRKFNYFKTFLNKNKKGKFNTILKYIFIFINDMHYYLLAKKKNIISDRCPIDKILGASIEKDRFRLFYQKLTQSMMPLPDYIILLSGDSQMIYTRTKEISVEKIEFYIEFYRNYIYEKKIPFLEIDTTINDLKSTFNLANSTIKHILKK